MNPFYAQQAMAFHQQQQQQYWQQQNLSYSMMDQNNIMNNQYNMGIMETRNAPNALNAPNASMLDVYQGINNLTNKSNPIEPIGNAKSWDNSKFFSTKY